MRELIAIKLAPREGDTNLKDTDVLHAVKVDASNSVQVRLQKTWLHKVSSQAKSDPFLLIERIGRSEPRPQPSIRV
jgi:hypothetical protein